MDKKKPGPKPLHEGDETVLFTMKLPASQKDKLMRLGGAAWVRERVKRAKEPQKE